MGSVEGSSVLVRKKAFPHVVGCGQLAPPSMSCNSLASHSAASSGITAHSPLAVCPLVPAGRRGG